MRCFEVEVEAKVAQVRMCRPDELNSMVPEFWTELPALIGRLSDDGGVRAVVLSSTGKHFSAGMDLGVFTAGGQDGSRDRGRVNANRQLMVARLQDSFSALERARMPILAAIQGGCVGGAVDLVTACDMRYATEDAFFVVQETNIGMTADVGTLQRLPKIIPDGVARELVYTGRRMPAARAQQVGLVNEVFPDHAAMVAGVTAIAAEIAAQSPLAIWGSKQMLVFTRDHSVADGLAHIAAWQTGAFDSIDMAEAFGAKAERRTPSYPDLVPAPGPLGAEGPL
jgi:enoyl-CoA hydratase